MENLENSQLTEKKLKKDITLYKNHVRSKIILFIKYLFVIRTFYKRILMELFVYQHWPQRIDHRRRDATTAGYKIFTNVIHFHMKPPSRTAALFFMFT